MSAMRRTVAVLIGALAAVAAAARAEETARQILDRQRALDDGARRWADRHEQLKMEILDPGREPRHMALDLFDRKLPDRNRQTMAYFSAPDSVKGTAFLAITRANGPADQWLYLPAAKRARRIGGEVRKQGFLGTDFTYQDLDLLAQMPSWSEVDAASSLRGEAVIDGVACHVIELTPKRPDVGYERIVLWLGRDDLITRQVEFFESAPSSGWFGLASGSSAAPTRRVRQSDVRTVGAIPVAHHVEMETPSAGTRTIVTFVQVTFDQGLPDDLFSQAAMDWGGYQASAK